MNIILSIKPKWAELIYSGKKTIEWRKSFPKTEKVLGESIEKVLLYETAPVKKITGFFTLKEIACYLVSSVCAQPEYIIKRGCVPLVDLVKYRENVDCLYGWMIDKVTKFHEPYGLEYVNLKRPPQSWCYDYSRAIVGDTGFLPF